MEKKLNNENDSTKRKSIDDHERRLQAEKSRAVDQQRRTNTMDGPRLVRDVMIKLGLQRQPAELEHINTKIFEASVSLEKLTLADHAREEQRNFESPIPKHHFVYEEVEGFQAYDRGYTTGLKAHRMTVAEPKTPNVLEGYIKGREEHRTDLYIGRDIENAQVPRADYEGVNQLLTPAYEGKVLNLGGQSLEVKLNDPELDR
ncbi:hypothetical protein QWA_10344 [Alcaligenes faecalis subsp. faecalis NCIB 8687]|uniref:hypothetical protein n=1 Tax=Alcaligenes faecalis TaxID=511 RepID=UPI000269EACA|nr:hypothetical protein [Alcaligenes faecalis]EJC62460.1 hypothetical protein QWA_10344 [Alcaligenes faecalis subsp. faecalis NCIB 8687]RSE63652.1 hypothetical protein EGT81_04970 [Alcaligenes faecalis]